MPAPSLLRDRGPSDRFRRAPAKQASAPGGGAPRFRPRIPDFVPHAVGVWIRHVPLRSSPLLLGFRRLNVGLNVWTRDQTSARTASSSATAPVVSCCRATVRETNPVSYVAARNSSSATILRKNDTVCG